MEDSDTPNTAYSSPRNRPKSLMDLPTEVRENIYQFCFSEEIMVVFAGPSPPPPSSSAIKHPADTSQVCPNFRLIYPEKHATFGDFKDMKQSTHQPTDWSTSNTGILYASRRMYLEAVQHFYKSCTFFFEDPVLSRKFLDTAGPHNLKHVSKIAVYYNEDSNISLSKWRLMCQQIAKSVPHVERLTIWIGSIIELEVAYLRCPAYEAALLNLAALKRITTLDVKKFVHDLLDNSSNEDAQWHMTLFTNEYTIRGIKEMIETGDRWAVDRQRIAFLNDYDR